MKKLALSALCVGVALLFTTHAAVAQKKFEGSIKWKVVSAQMQDQEQHDMVMNVKGDKFEIDMDAGMQGMLHMYVDHANKKLTMVMEAQKMGISQTIPDDAAQPTEGTQKDDNLKATGQKLTINGRAAELYTLTGPDEVVNMWMSKDFTPELAEGLQAAMSNNVRGSQAQKHAFRELAEKGYFPVKIESKTGGSLELVSVEPKSLPDSKFEVPTDITIMPANAMGGGMGRPGVHGGMPPHGNEH